MTATTINRPAPHTPARRTGVLRHPVTGRASSDLRARPR
jgi:hypothetical protein